MYEQLESRRLMAAGTTVSLSSGVLTVTGGDGADTINVSQIGGNVHVEYTDKKGAFHSDDIGGVTAINIDGGKKNDAIYYTGDTIGANIFGGNSGADQITVSDTSTGSSTVDGGNKDDSIIVLEANKTKVFGGDGNDQIEITDTGGLSSVDGGKGNDYIKVVQANKTSVAGGDGNDVLLLNFAALGNPGTLAGAEAFVLAGKGDDTIYIYDGTGTIDGGDGRDSLFNYSGGSATFSVTKVEQTF